MFRRALNLIFVQRSFLAGGEAEGGSFLADALRGTAIGPLENMIEVGQIVEPAFEGNGSYCLVGLRQQLAAVFETEALDMLFPAFARHFAKSFRELTPAQTDA